MSKEDFILKVILLGLLSAIAISYPVWIPVNTMYPAIGIVSGISPIWEWISMSTSLLLIIIVVLLLFWRSKRKPLLIILFLCAGVTILFDYNRIQPWFYSLNLMLGAFLFSEKTRDTFGTIGLILSFTYIWSGLQKLNFAFINETFPWLVELFPIPLPAFFPELGMLAAITETVAGVGLLFKKSRNISAIILVFMHFFIMMALGPFGHDSNAVVWPWNIVSITLLLTIFLQIKNDRAKSIFPGSFTLYKAFILVLLLLMPVFSLFDLWPMSLSSALYSGNKEQSRVYMDDSFSALLPPSVQSHVRQEDQSILLNVWAMEELGIAAYPDMDVHVSTFKYICQKHPENAPYLVLTTYSKPNIFNGNRMETSYFCNDLLPAN